MSKDTSIPVSRWMEIREKVSEKLKIEGSQQQKPTRDRVAEGLLVCGYIDVDFIQAEIDERDRRIAEKEERRQAALTKFDPPKTEVKPSA